MLEEIGRFNIAMNPSLPMEKLQGLQDRQGDLY